MSLLGLIGLVALTALVGFRGHPTVVEVWRVDDDNLGLEVALDTCNADVSVDLDEYDDRIVIRAKNHDWYQLDTGGDDCQDLVRVSLEKPLGDRRVTNSSGEVIVVAQR